MSDRAELIVERWQHAVATGANQFVLADADHPLRIYVGADLYGRACLSVALRERPPVVARFELLDIDVRQRPDDTWLLLLQLRDDTAIGQFTLMATDLLQTSRAASSEPAALSAFLTCLDRWRSLFRPVRGEFLTESQLRGLAAEIWTMMAMSTHREWADLLVGWQGPLSSPQDFRFSDGTAVEVKSTHRGSTAVRISSLSQLEWGGPLFLAVVVVERDESPAGITVAELCGRVEIALAGSFHALDEFRAKLDAAGFERSEAYYDEFSFVFDPPSFYAVDPRFPALRSNDVPSGIEQVSYEVSLASINDFLVEPGAIT